MLSPYQHVSNDSTITMLAMAASAVLSNRNLKFPC